MSDCLIPRPAAWPGGRTGFGRISVEPKVLEDVLEALAALDFPVNPNFT